MNTVYLDYHSSTPLSATARRAMEPFWGEHFGNPHSSEHSFGWAAATGVSAAKRKIAECVGAGEDEVLITSGATEANSIAILGYTVAQNSAGKVARILVGGIEHSSVLAAANTAAQLFGAKVEVVPVNQSGRVIVNELTDRLKAGPALVSIGAVNGEIGTVENLVKIGDIADHYGSVLHTDATQAQVAVDLGSALDSAHLVSLSGHKCYGPNGVGALVGRWDCLSGLAPIMPGGGQQNRLRGGTVPAVLAIGFAAAFDESQSELSSRTRHMRAMATILFEKLQDVYPDVCVIGPEARHAGNLSVMLPGIDAKALLAEAQPRLCASTSSACASGSAGTSHVLSAIGLSPTCARSVLRLSAGVPTTEREIEQAADILEASIQAVACIG